MLTTVDGPVARLAGFAKLPEDPGGGAGAGDRSWGFEPGAGGDGEMGDVTGVDPEKKKRKNGSTENEASSTDVRRVGALTEVVVLRDPPLVQVYRVESYGRRFRRALVFASQAAWCLADIDPDGHPALSDSAAVPAVGGEAGRRRWLARGVAQPERGTAGSSSRRAPSRGLLLAALLEEYAFWHGDGDLYGDAGAGAKHPRTMIHCRLLDDGDGAGVAGERAAVIRRIPLLPGANRDLRERSRRRRFRRSRWWTCCTRRRCSPRRRRVSVRREGREKRFGARRRRRGGDGSDPGGQIGRRGGLRTARRGPPRR